MTALRWDALTREQLSETLPDAVVVVPVGATEQHGPHLATAVDAIAATAVAERGAALAATPGGVVIAPTLPYGASAHHLPFGGTLSLRAETLRTVLLDLIASACAAGARRLLLLNGHGGNTATCAQVAADAAREQNAVVGAASYWELASPPAGVDHYPGHAGRFETSMMLALAPDRVRLDLARRSPGASRSVSPGLTVADPGAWKRIDGFTDDPREATAAEGETALGSLAQAVADAVDLLAATELVA